MDDAKLLNDYVNGGDPAAIQALVDRYAPLVYWAARRRVRASDLADDVTQATFFLLARKAGQIDRRRPLAGWLHRITCDLAIDVVRRERARQHHEAMAAAQRPEAIVPACSEPLAQLALHLDDALDALPRHDRETVLLRFFSGQTLEQIASARNVAISTVQRHLQRALQKLARDLRRRDAGVATDALDVSLAALAPAPVPESARLLLRSQAFSGKARGVGAEAARLARRLLWSRARRRLAYVSVALVITSLAAVAAWPKVRTSIGAALNPSMPTDLPPVGNPQSLPPVVISSIPAAGADDVDPALRQITVTFSKPMKPVRNVFYFRNDQHPPGPHLLGRPQWSADHRSFTVPVQLEPETDYWMSCNVDDPEFPATLVDEDGRRCETYPIPFRTRP